MFLHQGKIPFGEGWILVLRTDFFFFFDDKIRLFQRGCQRQCVQRQLEGGWWRNLMEEAGVPWRHPCEPQVWSFESQPPGPLASASSLPSSPCSTHSQLETSQTCVCSWTSRSFPLPSLALSVMSSVLDPPITDYISCAKL